MRNVAIIGLGYVGLPLAVQAAEKGYTVSGIDVSSRLVNMVNNRQSPFINDARFDESFQTISSESLTASTSFDALKEVDVVVICVPTPTENNIPDLVFVESAAKEVARHINDGQLIVLESTVIPGVTRDSVLAIIEKDTGKKVGEDFYLAHCPERIDPGNHMLNVSNLNRVVGGITEDCTNLAAEFYGSVIDAEIIKLGSAEEAEFVKSWENSYRNVTIALANEAAMICDALDMDIDNVLRGLQSKIDQFGMSLGKPGIGPGGHCIPEDIHYVIRKARRSGLDTRFLDSAADLNDRMPAYAVRKLSDLVKNNGQSISRLTVGVLGIAYKENIGDARRSPSADVARILVQTCKQTILHDPFVDGKYMNAIKGAKVAETVEELLDQCDAIFVATAHDQYIKLLTPQLLEKHNVKFVLDGRNFLDKLSFTASHVAYTGIGK